MSFGSAVKPSQMTKERRAIFLEVFSQLGEQAVEAVYCLKLFIARPIELLISIEDNNLNYQISPKYFFSTEEYTIIWKLCNNIVVS